MSSVAVIGHNRASPIEIAKDTLSDLNRFLTDTPVIETPEHAKQGALFVERTRKTLADLEDDRRVTVRPLNDEVKLINLEYGNASRPLETVLNELKWRLTDFAAREEAKRQHEADEKRKQAELAEMEARVAEQREREAKAGATVGEITDVAAAVVEADQRFNEYGRAARAAAIAERSVPVRLSSQLGGKALSLRTKETLVLDDAYAAIREMGVTDKIRDAVLSAARDYRRLHEKLPAGVSAKTTREI
jgi:hypothetical protein